MKLNNEELITGACAGLFFAPWIHYWVIPVSAATAVLWALGGTGWLGTKNWRRLGVPAVLSLASMGFALKALYATGVGYLILCVGYGIPNRDDQKGSPLGRFCLFITKNELLAGYLSKIIILGVLLASYSYFLKG